MSIALNFTFYYLHHVKKRNEARLLTFTSKGIYCSIADVYLDPWRPVNKAIISHGHSDHARWGHQKYITQNDNVPIIKHRLGAIEVVGKAYGETFSINNVTFSFHPAGHVIGSSQIRVAHKGEVWVFTGDYKVVDDGVSAPFEPVRCHTFITESTFGLPVFNWPDPKDVHKEVNRWWENNQKHGITSILCGYSLGKAQRLLKYLDPEIGNIYTHTAIENMTEVLRPNHEFPDTKKITAVKDKKEAIGGIVLIPPSGLGNASIKKLGDIRVAYASGWMAFRGARRRRAVDKAFVLSDHADWNGLISAIKATACENVITTHGYTELFSKYLNENGWNAKTERTAYESETPEMEIVEVG